MRPGDWICRSESCGNLNFASKMTDVCRRCPATRTGPLTTARAKTPFEARPGDWTCPNEECGNLNWAVRAVCQKVLTPPSNLR